ncbi:MAG TPA: argininosuccinate lyase [Verrucomicrobiae bacterium]|nr:argininosuccinate lyase [Verrucomicrobiae bacterium]
MKTRIRKVTSPRTPKKLWGGRFTELTDLLVEAFTESVSFDWRLYPHDIEGSIAHARMLGKVGVLKRTEVGRIVAGLRGIKRDIEHGRFRWDPALEDVHMNIETRLTERVGEIGKKLHTGRSRNDQVATDLRLYLRHETSKILGLLDRATLRLAELAEREAATIMPGFTHMQIAQPVTFGHHMLAWREMMVRDTARLEDCRKRINVMPLGSAALAGTVYPINRAFTARLLGFASISVNSLDAVSDRDFAIEFAAACSLLMVHLSRMCEELILWVNPLFGFVTLPDRFCTGSSIMPQKKNPDVPELIRGNTGRVVGGLMALLTLMKSQPLAYNRDNQEDKPTIFDMVDTVTECLQVFGELVPAIEVNRVACRAAAVKGYSTATDLADYLVRRGVAFRDAHHAVGAAVAYAVKKDVDLAELKLEELKRFSKVIGNDVYKHLTPEGSVAARSHYGGTAPAQVRAAAQRARRSQK